MAQQSRKLKANVIYEQMLKNVSALCFWNSCLNDTEEFLPNLAKLLGDMDFLLSKMLERFESEKDDEICC